MEHAPALGESEAVFQDLKLTEFIYLSVFSHLQLACEETEH